MLHCILKIYQSIETALRVLWRHHCYNIYREFKRCDKTHTEIGAARQKCDVLMMDEGTAHVPSEAAMFKKFAKNSVMETKTLKTEIIMLR